MATLEEIEARVKTLEEDAKVKAKTFYQKVETIVSDFGYHAKNWATGALAAVLAYATYVHWIK